MPAPNVAPKRAHLRWLALAALLVPATAARADGPPAPFRHGSWPFQPPVRPELPQVRSAAWCRNPIDAFILAELEAAGLEPSPAAEKLELLRRVSFDLTGLPPTVAEQDALLADERENAYEESIDRLLNSPGYGERWAQHWLDLVRYAETDGFKADEHRPNAYKYRDYVIRALNDDLPFDRFVAQQLAGDELEPDNPQALIATGLNRLYPDEYNAANLEQRRQEILDDITGTTGLALMGLTMSCAQCHDHKFDEILQADYFRLQAFFAPLVARDDLSDSTPEERERYACELAAWEAATQEIRAEIDQLLAAKREELRQYALTKFREEIRQAVNTPQAQRTAYQQQIALLALKQAVVKDNDAAAKLSPDDKQKYEELARRLAQFDHLRPAPLPTVMAAGDVGRSAPPTFLLEGGNWRKPADEVQPGFPQFLGEASPEIQSPTSGAATTGRRTALARWLTRPDHPLTARVLVNRLWQQHFGLGIVPSANDFGAQGDPPTHPRLLDWLAVELVERGWGLKRIHRLMVTSAAYRQSSRVWAAEPVQAAALAKDGGDRLLWHARRRRLEGEALRDAMLAVSGELNRRMFGPSARPELPEGLSKSYAWQPDASPADRNRRSIYVLAKRNLRYPLFDAFDLPDMHHSCPRRATTTTAPQALLLLNGEFSLDRARHWAGQLLAETGDEAALITAAYRQAFARRPNAAEIESARGFLDAQAASIAGRGAAASALALPLPAIEGTAADRAAAIVDFCHALFNSNEFLYVD